MLMFKLRIVGAVVLAGIVIGSGAGVLAFRTFAAEQAAPPAPDRPSAPAVSPTVTELAQARLKAARAVNDDLMKLIQLNRASVDELALWAPHLLEAELDVSTTKAQRVAALTAYLNRMIEAEKWARMRFDSGRITSIDYGKATVQRLEAELRLAKEKAKE
jgi:hypothetical protein